MRRHGAATRPKTVNVATMTLPATSGARASTGSRYPMISYLVSSPSSLTVVRTLFVDCRSSAEVVQELWLPRRITEVRRKLTPLPPSLRSEDSPSRPLLPALSCSKGVLSLGGYVELWLDLLRFILIAYTLEPIQE